MAAASWTPAAEDAICGTFASRKFDIGFVPFVLVF
jgi:hypothetical protein